MISDLQQFFIFWQFGLTLYIHYSGPCSGVLGILVPNDVTRHSIAEKDRPYTETHSLSHKE